MKKIILPQDKRSEESSKLFKFLTDRIKGQGPVVSNFLKYFEGFTSGLRRPNSPIYKGLFLGLPNTGKRLFVESLAEYLFGDKTFYSEISCGAFDSESVAMVPAMLARAELDLPLLLKNKDYCELMANRENIGKNLTKLQRDLFQLCAQVNDDSANFDVLKKEIGAVTKNCIDLSKAGTDLDEKLGGLKLDRPVSIVVFSDFEKSCPAMLNIIQRVLKDGRVSFESGEEVDLTNSIVIVTSTIIAEAMMEVLDANNDKTKVGFIPPGKEAIEKMDKAIYDKLVDLQKIYKPSIRFAVENIRPDLLSLFDRISIFRPLFQDSLREIVDLELAKFRKELKSAHLSISLKVGDEVKDFIAKESSDRPEFGASTLLAKFDKYIRRELARLRNCKEVKRGDVLSVNLECGKVVFSREARKGEAQ